jgi:hypothetical protein
VAKPAAWVAAAAVTIACGGSTDSDGSGKGGSSGTGGTAGAGGSAGLGGSSGADPGCTEPNPAGCSMNACPPNAVCDTSVGCMPSQCSCSQGTWVCTEDCGGGVCVPVGDDCGTAAKQIASSLTDQACTTIVRLAYTSLAPKGWQVVCGKYAFVDEATARATAESATGFGQGGALLGGPTPEDEWVLWEAPGDFGGVGVVNARSGLAVFGGGIIWMGSGQISHPSDWRDAASLGFGCGSSGLGYLPARGFDLQSGGSLDASAVSSALSVVFSSALPVGLAMAHSAFDAVVLLYPPTVGALDPEVAEYVVLVNSGWLD